jgi:hypothetical protein
MVERMEGYQSCCSKDCWLMMGKHIDHILLLLKYLELNCALGYPMFRVSTVTAVRWVVNWTLAAYFSSRH